MIALALMLALSQAKPIEVSEERERPRVKAALSVGGGPILPILSPFPSNSPSSWAWAGLAVEGGVVLNDRIVFSGRASFFTNFGALASEETRGSTSRSPITLPLARASACSGWRAPSEASRE
ncbi:MAG: hypothetical protein Q8N23_32660 [Archangium sp.]|nr:hypothetical protein [Archangium sp.]MDP3572753.1 hypothetical protein [Archangium sp.]